MPAEHIIKQQRDAREVGNVATVETSSVECLVRLTEARDCIGSSCMHIFVNDVDIQVF